MHIDGHGPIHARIVSGIAAPDARCGSSPGPCSIPDCTSANSGTAGLAAALPTRPGVIILDIALPGLNGYDFADIGGGRRDRPSDGIGQNPLANKEYLNILNRVYVDNG